MTRLLLQGHNLVKRHVGGKVGVGLDETSLVVLHAGDHGGFLLDGLVAIDEAQTALGCQGDGHVVVDTTLCGDDSSTLLLLSVADYDGLTSALNVETPGMASGLAADYQEGPLASWRIPTDDEARQLRAAYLAHPDSFEDLLAQSGGDPVAITDGKGNNIRYLCAEARHTYSFKPGSAYNSASSPPCESNKNSGSIPME